MVSGNDIINYRVARTNVFTLPKIGESLPKFDGDDNYNVDQRTNDL